ncbi:hypothetical protein EBM89_11430 [Cellulomonas triticagri]|uniref:Uncharacterized protein n=1 Tax=Cellulomonas triticagri TaxID=2483352 RepID=A0A3M2J8E8_9CELL|nr:hypothetical protein EBM89_11430 [Cellulomonas triticagri]
MIAPTSMPRSDVVLEASSCVEVLVPSSVVVVVVPPDCCEEVEDRPMLRPPRLIGASTPASPEPWVRPNASVVPASSARATPAPTSSSPPVTPATPRVRLR